MFSFDFFIGLCFGVMSIVNNNVGGVVLGKSYCSYG